VLGGVSGILGMSVGQNAPGFPHALQQLPQRHLGRAGDLDLLARLEALLEVGLLHLPRHIPPHVGCFGAQSPRWLALSIAPAHVLEVRPRLAHVQLAIVIVVLFGALHQRRRVFAGDALLLVRGRAGHAVAALGERDAALGLPPCDAAAQLADLVDEMDAIGRLGVLGAYVQVEVPSQARRGKGLAAEGAVLVLCSLQLRCLRGGGAGCRAVLRLAHDAGRVALVLGFETSSLSADSCTCKRCTRLPHDQCREERDAARKESVMSCKAGDTANERRAVGTAGERSGDA
jgi:hypothetical protein